MRRSGQSAVPPVRSKDRFLVFGAPEIAEAEIDEVVASMKARWLGTGPKVARFENDFKAYIGGNHAAAVNSCTAALHLSLVAMGLQPGDEVITTPMTFCATANAIIHAGGTPVLADIDPVTLNIDPAALAARVTPRTRAAVIVHFAGRPCDLDAITTLCERHGITLIEDCAHAIETQYKGVHVGTFGRYGCFSFYATKNLTTGEGGMVIARHRDDVDRVKVLALHGMSKDAWKRFSDDGYKHYDVVACGFKYNMMDLQAAIGIHQLARLEQNWLRRQQIWQTFDRELAGTGLGLPAPARAHERHALHLYTVQVDPARCGLDRDSFMNGMSANNIGVGVHYRSLVEHPYYRERYGWQGGDVPVAFEVGQRILSLPLSAAMTDADVADTITAVKRVLARP
ncbi:MAG: DegT/DnrJ/EryC1/StrS family aminotransferase [Planctomycetes bacterium]|nr:DegT/DnrJ/EryC1/StrS family aminotransferase [Planctomycetota bacterium]